MKRINKIAALVLAMATVATVGGCAASDIPNDEEETGSGIITETPPEVITPPSEENGGASEDVPAVQKVSYLNVVTNGVNIRSGAGTGYSVRGSAEKSTMYALNGSSGNWYQTAYKNGSAYIYSDYCNVVEMEPSEDERVEKVIAEGTKLLGVPYVYGAPRYHNGNGVLASNFDINKFDCSSLMQYMFYKGAGINLQMTSRSQALYGKDVAKKDLQRGDLMFFTNSTRYNYSGIERIGHVALYLGDNWILHTASDYAKIEQISATRWSYYITAKRMF